MQSEELQSLALLHTYPQIVGNPALAPALSDPHFARALLVGDFPDAKRELKNVQLHPSAWRRLYEREAVSALRHSGVQPMAFVYDHRGQMRGCCELKFAPQCSEVPPLVLLPTEELGFEMTEKPWVSIRLTVGATTVATAGFPLVDVEGLSRLGVHEESKERTEVVNGVEFNMSVLGNKVYLRAVCTPFPAKLCAFDLFRDVGRRKKEFGERFVSMKRIRGLARSIYTKNTTPAPDDLPFSAATPLPRSQSKIIANLEGNEQLGLLMHDLNHFYVGRKINGKPCCKEGHTFTRPFLENWLVFNLGATCPKCPLCT